MSSQGLKGRLGFAEVGQLLAQLDLLCAGDVLDLSEVTQVDSAGLSLLLELSRRSRAKGKALSFQNAPTQLRELARFFKLDATLKL